ncbi:hypothetical protein ACTFIT_001473 [Dictyostelium discoideum]
MATIFDNPLAGYCCIIATTTTTTPIGCIAVTNSPEFHYSMLVIMFRFNTGKCSDDSPSIELQLANKYSKVILSTTSATTKGTTTGPDGNYQFKDVPPSEYCIEAKIPDHQIRHSLKLQMAQLLNHVSGHLITKALVYYHSRESELCWD